jgi:hypothetical protein
VAPLRASDADRNVVHSLLTDAFADGRLDREEYDDRTAFALQARTLGELPPLVADLVPDRPLLPARTPLLSATPGDLRVRAEEKWRDDRRSALMGFVGSAVLTWAIWAAVMFGGFPWPLIVNAMAFMNFVRVAANRRELVAQELKRLEHKQAKALQKGTGSQPKDRPGS